MSQPEKEAEKDSRVTKSNPRLESETYPQVQCLHNDELWLRRPIPSKNEAPSSPLRFYLLHHHASIRCWRGLSFVACSFLTLTLTLAGASVGLGWTRGLPIRIVETVQSTQAPKATTTPSLSTPAPPANYTGPESLETLVGTCLAFEDSRYVPLACGTHEKCPITVGSCCDFHSKSPPPFFKLSL